ncbi:MAG TPA: OmcA/MtrC family decaheme c-type cytochrome, partial [Thermoanaerobaculia bacterium]|nr:OmcA/MtrC family decaheme c-type cytochrome [Thermoanaerobaculia bacterium]
MRKRVLLVLVLLGSMLLSAQAARRHASQPGPTDYSINFIEHYISQEDVIYIRPGLTININSITIPADRRPVVDVTLTDSAAQPIDRLGKVTPGVVTLGFVLGWYNPDTRQYVNDRLVTVTSPANSPNPGATATQAAADAGGTYTDLDLGHFTYRFGTVLPANDDATKTHTLAVYANRNLQDTLGKTYLADVERDFRPDGQPVTETWDKINVATSCNNCHDPLTAHGTTGRMNPKTCALCHQPQSTDPDTGNTVDFKVMIHKIHMGAQLPSVLAGHPYQIIGFGQAVNDFSTVVFPQDIRNCANCHEGTDPKARPSQSFAWYTYPSRAACGSCHDNIDWTTGANHPGGPQADDSACASCHVPDSG